MSGPARHSAGRLAQVACLLEATARKPGNVHRFSDFEDSNYLDFALSAAAIGPALDRARSEGVGVAVLAAVEATRAVVATNTNLGMILLLAPLAAVPEGDPAGTGVSAVLNATTVADAALVYRAVRLAGPAGLGETAEQDIHEEPSVSLLAAMQLAAGQDLVARQYANGFADVFGIALPRLRADLRAGFPLETAIIRTHLALIAGPGDTLILRKRGEAVAAEASVRAAAVLDRDWPAGEGSAASFEGFDAWLRSDGHARNPGATADLVAAALFAALREGTIALPLEGWSARPAR